MKTFIGTIALAVSFFALHSQAQETSVLVCHAPPGSPTNTQLIDVGYKAAMKHVQMHGDALLDQAVELCDGVDNTCDGVIDEGFDLSQPCTEGLGACLASGITVCGPDGTDTICGAPIITPPGISCDMGPNYDGNCNGTPDVQEESCSSNACDECDEALSQGLDQCRVQQSYNLNSCERQYAIDLNTCARLPTTEKAICEAEAVQRLDRCLSSADTAFETCTDTVNDIHTACRTDNMCDG